MKKKERRPEESGNQWLNTMCEVLKGGVLAGVASILALLLCAVLVSAGVLPVNGMYGAVLACCVLGAMAGGRCWRDWGWVACCFCCCSPRGSSPMRGQVSPTAEPESCALACVVGLSRDFWQENPRKNAEDD